MYRPRQGTSPSGTDRADDLGGGRGRAAEARSLSGAVRWIPRSAGIGLEDLSGPLRQQQVLGGCQRGRAAGRSPRLRRSHRNPPGRADRRRASSFVRPRRDDLRPLALRAGAGSQAGALRNGAPFKDWVLPAAMERVRRKLTSTDDGNRQMVDILNAVLTDGLPA